MTATTRRGLGAAAAALSLAVGAALALGPHPAGAAAAPAVRIGSKNFTEQVVLGELYAQALEAKGVRVDRKLNMGGTLIAHQALVNREIDMYPEYTGTALLNVLKAETMTDPEAVYQKVKKHYEEQFKLTWLDKSPFNNGYVMVVKPQTAREYNLKTLSDLARVAGKLRLGSGPEFRDRKDGLPGLKQAYGMEFADAKAFAIALRYEALKTGNVDVVNGYATDGQITANRLVRLKDDKGLWPPYNVAPVIDAKLAQDHTVVPQTLNAVTALLTDERMSEMNWQVDGEKEEPKDVARAFLKKHALVK
jgi:osmoprotectant transport system substrate-binding protein